VADRPPFVSFLSDYGRADEFVGVCHAVILDIVPTARIVDITHDVPAFDVRAGALALVRAVQYLPEGVVLAVVDPGVGSERRCVAVEVENGYLVGPDNGLLAPAVAMLGGPDRVIELTSPEHRLPSPGPTFAGRDVMAPAAAHLLAGVPISVLGPEVEPATLTPALVPLPCEAHDGRIRAEVLWVDRFGNCQLNVAPEQLESAGARPGDALEVTFGDPGTAGERPARRARWVRAFADAKPSELIVLVDSYGMCALAVDRRSAATELGVRAGSPITLATGGASAPIGDPGTPIALRNKEARA
jgi:S-adenosyl-L-methionine hydrolase (adenosine-forming)